MRAITSKYPNDAPRCVQELLALWNEYDGDDYLPIVAACEVSTRPAIPAIIEAVSAMGARPESQRALSYFFGRSNGAPLLSSKMQDPEPLLKLAVDTGHWTAIPQFVCDQRLKQEYILDGMRKDDRSYLVGPSLVDLFPESRLAELRGIFRDHMSASHKRGVVWNLARDLTVLGDTSILSELQALINDRQLSDFQRDEYRVFKVKLEYQHSVPELLRILRTEQESKRVLTWVVGRLLWLKTDKRSIYVALEQNRDQGGRIASEVLQQLRWMDRPDAGRVLPRDFPDSLILDPEEFRNHLRSSKEATGFLEKVRLADSLSLRRLLASAPAGD